MSLWEMIESAQGTENIGNTSNISNTEKPVIAFVGAGGKTTCILEVAREAAARGKKVFVTTTTHMESPEYFSMGYAVGAEPEELCGRLREERLLAAGEPSEDTKKIQALSECSLKSAYQEADMVLIEADGSKRYPVKVPGLSEPVIWEKTTHIVIVAGASAVGRPLGQVCHRIEAAVKLLKEAGQFQKRFQKRELWENTKVTGELLGWLLEKGYVETLKAAFPGKKLVVLLNQADILENQAAVRNKMQEQLSVPLLVHGWNKAVHFIFLAAGFSRRFGENKLLYPLLGKPMYLHLLERLQRLQQMNQAQSLVAVTQYEEVLAALQKIGVAAVKNKNSQSGISSSLKLGLEYARRTHNREKENFYMFFVADQPYLTEKTIREFLSAFLKSSRGIGCVCRQGVSGNPVIFHEKYVPELQSLEGDKGGKQVLKKHPEDVFFYEVEAEKELMDIDSKEFC